MPGTMADRATSFESASRTRSDGGRGLALRFAAVGVTLLACLVPPCTARAEAQSEAAAVPGRLPWHPTGEAFLAVVVSDVAAGETWYTRRFGLERLRAVDEPDGLYRIRLLRGAGLVVELIEDRRALDPAELRTEGRERAPIRGLFKVGVTVRELDALYEAFRELGDEVRGPGVEDPGLGRRTFVVLDPFGNRLQFFEDGEP